MIFKGILLGLTSFLFYGVTVQTFECPEAFGDFPDPDDYHYYYVCENYLPLRGDCNSTIFVPEFCNKPNSQNTTCTSNSGNGTSSMNDTSTDYDNFGELNCTQNNNSTHNTNNTTDENETYEYENFPHYISDNETAATNMSTFNETDINSCNQSLSIQMDFVSKRYVIKCGNGTNNSLSGEPIDYEDFEKVSNDTIDFNNTDVFENYPHFSTDNETTALNMSSFNESDFYSDYSSNETFPLVIDIGFVNTDMPNHENNKPTKTTVKPVEGTTIIAGNDGKHKQNQSTFVCPPKNGRYPDITTCQAYWECKNNITTHKMCKGKFVFNPVTATCEEDAKCK